jgi:WD40 repeat protein
MVIIWDLQRMKCITFLAGHSDTITGIMYNCCDEYLASISVCGELILHNLTCVEVKYTDCHVIPNSYHKLVLHLDSLCLLR